MDGIEPDALKLAPKMRKLPERSPLEVLDSGSTQTVVAHCEGLNVRTFVGLLVGCFFAVPSLAIACFAAIALLGGTFNFKSAMFGICIGSLVTFYGYYVAKPSLLAGWCKLVLRISDGILVVEHQGPFTAERHKIKLKTVVRTSIYADFIPYTTDTLWVRVPNFDFQPANTTGVRRRPFFSHKLKLVCGRSRKDLVWLQDWIDDNVDATRDM